MITKEELKDKIVELITEVQGCKATELVTKSQFNLDMIRALEVYDLPTVLAELLHERRLIEVEYVLPQLNFRAKSFLLPAGVEVKINKGE
jgi:hypothetical protein